jgi:hypothetical protein
MERGTSILRKAVDYASSKMLMVTSGRGLVETSRSFMLHQIDEAEGLSYLRREGLHM